MIVSDCLACHSEIKQISTFTKSFVRNDTDEWVEFSWPINYCSHCGLIRIDGDFELFEAYHYALATYRDPGLEEQWREERQPYLAWIVRCIESLKPPVRSVIDFGCSYGHMLELMQDANWTVGAVEIDERLLKLVKGKLAGAVVVEDLDLVPDKGTWGVCSMIDSLYCVEDPLHTLTQAKRILAPGGYLVLRITNRNWLIRMMAHWKKEMDSFLIASALTHFSVKSIEHLVKRAGFRNLRWIHRERGRTHSELRSRLAYGFLPMISHISFGRVVVAPGLVLVAQK